MRFPRGFGFVDEQRLVSTSQDRRRTDTVKRVIHLNHVPRGRPPLRIVELLERHHRLPFVRQGSANILQPRLVKQEETMKMGQVMTMERGQSMKMR